MYLKIKNRKIKIIKLDSFWKRFKGLKFVLEPIDYGVMFPKKKTITTDFLCQRVDIILTDKNNKILYMYNDFPSEKRIWPKRKVYNIYFLPVGTVKNFKVNEVLPIKNKV